MVHCARARVWFLRGSKEAVQGGVERAVRSNSPIPGQVHDAIESPAVHGRKKQNPAIGGTLRSCSTVDRGRDAGCPAPPAQIRTRGTTPYGSYRRSDAQTKRRVRVKDAYMGYPSGQQRLHPGPGESVALVATPL